MINRQMKEWLDKLDLPLGERILTASLLASFLNSPLGLRKDYSRQHFNNMLREYAKDKGYQIKESNSTFGKYMVFSLDGVSGSEPLKKITTERLIHDTSLEFFEWSNNIPSGERVRAKVLKSKFADDKLGGLPYYNHGSSKNYYLTPQLFYKWLSKLNYYRNGRAPIEGRDSQGRWLILI